MDEMSITISDECCICLNIYNETEEKLTLENCRHTFHKHCIDEIVNAGHKNCPLCRSNMNIQPPLEIQSDCRRIENHIEMNIIIKKFICFIMLGSLMSLLGFTIYGFVYMKTNPINIQH